MESEKISQLKQQLSQALSAVQEYEKQQGMTPESSPTKPTSRDLSLNDLRSKINKIIEEDIPNHYGKMEQSMGRAVDEFKEEIREIELEVKRALGNESVEIGGVRPCFMAQKKHKTQSPLLIRMLNSQDFRTIYHIFIAIMIVMCLGEIGKSYLTNGVVLDLSLFIWAFGGFHYVFVFWFIMAGWASLVIPLVQAINKHNLSKNFWLPMYLFLILMIYVGPATFVICMDLPMASSLTVSCEMARMFMKMHSYVREKLMFGNGPNEHADFIPPELVTRGLTKENMNIPHITIESYSTELKRFLFFFFCPTLIYRDSYPRIPGQRRWKKILFNFLNVMGTIFYTFFIFTTFCIPYFHETWDKHWDGSYFAMSIFKTMLPATMLLILMFFGFLHSWQNMGAEIMRFGDRKFYEDWWNVHNFADYYRKWNLVVHDWLHHYVYQDLVRFTKAKASRFTALCLVFAFSAFIHELIIAVSMKFVYPILFLLFGGPGVLYVYLTRSKKQAFNIFVWSMFFVGMGLLVIFYTWEYYARQSLDLYGKYGWKAVFIPHSWILG